MIFFLVTERGSHTLNPYVKSWGPTPGSRIRILRYEDLLQTKALSQGTYIFSDLERLSPSGLQLAYETWKVLSEAGPRVRLLNHPSRVLCRYDLLRKLYDEGKNCFKAIRASESLHSLRYPVFVRDEHEHNGNLTPLLYGRNDLVRGLRFLRLRGYHLCDLLVVEFCDTSDSAGVFRKYSAFIVGDEILPRHVIFSRHWCLKKPDLVDPSLVQEREEYLCANPHKSWLIETFKLSGIEYGRIDYSLMGNIPQVWEINTNPTVRKLTPRLTSAFEAVNCQSDSKEMIPITIDKKLAQPIVVENRQQLKISQYCNALKSLRLYQWIKPFTTRMKAFIYSGAR